MREDEHGPEGAPVPGLEELYVDRAASQELERRIMEDFRRSMRPAGRRREGASGWISRTIAFRVAAALVIFAVGWGLGASTARAPTPVEETASSAPLEGDYMMLLWENGSTTAGRVAGGRPQPPDDPAAVAERYASWARSVAESGVRVSGEELGSDRAIVGSASRPASQEARVGGFFLVDVRTLDEARSLAEGHPHVTAGGVIEIAPVVRR